jgi:hypothetical protein
MSDPKAERIIAALGAAGSPLLEEGVTLAVDHLLGSRLADVIDLAEVAELVLTGLNHENVARAVARHVKPGWARYSAKAGVAKAPVSAFVPDAAREAIRTMVVTTKPPPAKWAENIVDPALMRKLLAPVWVNLLVNFGKRVVGGAADGGGSATGRVASSIAGRLSRSVQERAEKLVDAGRSVMGGLGAEVERRVQAAAREFADGAEALFRDALRDRLQSEEGRELLSRIGSGVVDHVMKTELAALQADAAHLPVNGILDTVPSILSTAVSGPFVQSVVRAEVAAFVEVEGARTLAELLDETGLREPVRALMIGRGSSVVQGVVATPGFAAWLERLLQA